MLLPTFGDLHKRRILCLHDSTEFNFTKHKESKGSAIGPITNPKNSGVLLHSGLCIDAQSELPVGIGYLAPWIRDTNRPNRHERNYKNQRFEEKESYRWPKYAQLSAQLGKSAELCLQVADRECDIFDFHDQMIEADYKYLVRCNHNRKLHQKDMKLFEYIDQQPVASYTEVHLKKGSKKHRRSSSFPISIKFGQVNLAKSSSASSTKKYVSVYFVEAKQLDKYPNDIPPMHWRLLTNEPVTNIETAQQMIRYYMMRWQIEEWFAVCKQKGFNFEQSQVKTRHGLLKLLVIILWAAMKHLTLVKKREIEDESAHQYFTELEIDALKKLNKKYEGNTEKQQNPFEPLTIAWAVWIIARMGGWKGYYSEGKPGIHSLKRGLEKLSHIMILYEP